MWVSRFNSPYHRRLDWEVWIHTTASTEDAALAGRKLSIPPFIRKLAVKLLQGDTEILEVMGTSIYDLLRLSRMDSNSTITPTVPTAIKAEWWWYTFSKPPKTGETRKAWWTRKRIDNNPATVWTERDANDGASVGVRKLAPQRGYILLLSVCGSVWWISIILRRLFGPIVTSVAEKTACTVRMHKNKHKSHGVNGQQGLSVVFRGGLRELLFELLTGAWLVGVLAMVSAVSHSFPVSDVFDFDARRILVHVDPFLFQNMQEASGQEGADVTLYKFILASGTMFGSVCAAQFLRLAVWYRYMHGNILVSCLLAFAVSVLARDAAHLQILLDRI